MQGFIKCKSWILFFFKNGSLNCMFKDEPLQLPHVWVVAPFCRLVLSNKYLYKSIYIRYVHLCLMSMSHILSDRKHKKKLRDLKTWWTFSTQSRRHRMAVPMKRFRHWYERVKKKDMVETYIVISSYGCLGWSVKSAGEVEEVGGG